MLRCYGLFAHLPMQTLCLYTHNLSRVVRKLAFCIYIYAKTKDADQLRGNREADQRLRFRYKERTIPLLPKYEFPASSHLVWLYSLVCVRPDSPLGEI